MDEPTATLAAGIIERAQSHRVTVILAGMEAPPEEREMDLLIPPAPELGRVYDVKSGSTAQSIGGSAFNTW